MESSSAAPSEPSPPPAPHASSGSSPAGTPEASRLIVIDRPEDQRYELHLDDERVGLADYSVRDGVVTIPHVETDPVHRGKGFAAHLMTGILDDLRARSLTVRPICPYADAFMRRNPDTEDLRAS